VGPRNIRRGGGAHWRHVANTIELSVCCGDAALCQFTLTVCYCLLKSKIISVFVSCLVSDQLRVISIKAVHTGGRGLCQKWTNVTIYNFHSNLPNSPHSTVL